MAAVLIGGLLVCGCASGAKAGNMIPSDYRSPVAFPYSVRVEVEGGEGTHPLWMSRLSDADFRDAVLGALSKAGLFAKVARDGDTNYLLQIRIVKLGQQPVGFTLDSQLATAWTLTEVTSQRIVWKDVITTTHAATVGDAFVAIKRVRLANEGAGRKNIERALQEIAKLRL